jgi:hypothetical protein
VALIVPVKVAVVPKNVALIVPVGVTVWLWPARVLPENEALIEPDGVYEVGPVSIVVTPDTVVTVTKLNT